MRHKMERHRRERAGSGSMRGKGAATMSRKVQICVRHGAKRPNYFAGKLLTAADLQAEQNYHASKLRELTRAVLGVGIIAGLAVSRSGSRVTVESGTAVDGNGRLLELPAPCQFDLPSTAAAWDVFLGAGDIPGDPLPDMGPEETMVTGKRHGSIQEVTTLWIAAASSSAPTPVTAEAVWLARIAAGRGRVARTGRRTRTNKPTQTSKATAARKKRRRQ